MVKSECIVVLMPEDNYLSAPFKPRAVADAAFGIAVKWTRAGITLPIPCPQRLNPANLFRRAETEVLKGKAVVNAGKIPFLQNIQRQLKPKSPVTCGN